jgi:hypothetical protein
MLGPGVAAAPQLPASLSDRQTQGRPVPQQRPQRRTFYVIFSLFCNLR